MVLQDVSREGTALVSLEHEQMRRQQILDAALACFSRRGYHATSMEDIVRESGLSVGALYSYFPSKEELFAALDELRFTRAMERLRGLLQGSGSPTERLEGHVLPAGARSTGQLEKIR